VLISTAEVLPSCCARLYSLVASQIFLPSPLAAHTEHSPYCIHRRHHHVCKQRAQSYSEPIVHLSSREYYQLQSIVTGSLRITVDYLYLLGTVISCFLILETLLVSSVVVDWSVTHPKTLENFNLMKRHVRLYDVSKQWLIKLLSNMSHFVTTIC